MAVPAFAYASSSSAFFALFQEQELRSFRPLTLAHSLRYDAPLRARKVRPAPSASVPLPSAPSGLVNIPITFAPLPLTGGGLKGLVEMLAPTTHRDTVASPIPEAVAGPLRTSIQRHPYEVPTHAVPVLQRFGIEASGFGFKAHPHRVHRTLEVHLLFEHWLNLCRSPSAALFMKQSKFEKLQHENANFEALANDNLTARDTTRHEQVAVAPPTQSTATASAPEPAPASPVPAEPLSASTVLGTAPLSRDLHAGHVSTPAAEPGLIEPEHSPLAADSSATGEVSEFFNLHPADWISPTATFLARRRGGTISGAKYPAMDCLLAAVSAGANIPKDALWKTICSYFPDSMLREEDIAKHGLSTHHFAALAREHRLQATFHSAGNQFVLGVAHPSVSFHIDHTPESATAPGHFALRADERQHTPPLLGGRAADLVHAALKFKVGSAVLPFQQAHDYTTNVARAKNLISNTENGFDGVLANSVHMVWTVNTVQPASGEELFYPGGQALTVGGPVSMSALATVPADVTRPNPVIKGAVAFLTPRLTGTTMKCAKSETSPMAYVVIRGTLALSGPVGTRLSE